MSFPATISLILSLAVLVFSLTASAFEDGGPRPEVLTASFLAAHPDIKHRMDGLDALERGDAQAAYRSFLRASRFADKPAQAMVADMLWSGNGVDQDRAIAYVWMDLAAERGYRTFTALREKYWEGLDAAQRDRAQREGLSIYDEYGDAVAKERLTRKLDRERRKSTGSRTGFVGNLVIRIPGPGGWMTVGGDTYYADRYWVPEEYFAWQDRVWSAPPGGVVDVGPIETSPAPDSAADADQRDPAD